MTRIILAAFFLAVSAAPAAAQSVDHEVLKFLGWNAACSLAIAHYSYPYIGEAIANEPIVTKIGTLTIPPGKNKSRADWGISWDGSKTWRPMIAGKTMNDFGEAGYGRPGYVETIRPEPIARRPGLEQLLRSTETLKARDRKGWPGKAWTLARIHYSPLTTCAFVLYELEEAQETFFNYRLVRIYNPAVRTQRARAHVENGLLLFKGGDIEGALEEMEIAAQLSPTTGPARYHHAALLTVSGHMDQALVELDAAIKLNPRYEKMALDNVDFDSLYNDARFKKLTGQKPNPYW